MISISPRERIHRAPFGHGMFIPGTTRAKLAALPDEAPSTQNQWTGPLWTLLAEHGIPAGQAGVDVITAKVPNIPEKPLRRLNRFFATAGMSPISKKDIKTVYAILEAVTPGIGEPVVKAVVEQEAAAWRTRSLHPSFLALSGEPAEAFCLVPDPNELAALAANWPEPDPEVSAQVQNAIGDSIKLAAADQPSLNCWRQDRPTGLWLWNWRTSDGIGMLNGGNVFTNYIFAVYTQDGALSSVRESESPGSYSPPGLALSHKGCTWTFTERAWSASEDRKMVLHQGINLEHPLRPQPRQLGG